MADLVVSDGTQKTVSGNTQQFRNTGAYRDFKTYSSGIITLGYTGWVVNSTAQALSSGSPVLTVIAGAIQINNASQGLSSTGIPLTVHLAVSNASQAVSSTSPLLDNLGISLSMANATNGVSSEAPVLSLTGSIAVQSSLNSMSSTEPSLSDTKTIVVNNSLNANTSSSLGVSVWLSNLNAQQTLSSGQPTLTTGLSLSVANASHAITSQSLALSSHNALPIDSGLNNVASTSPVLTTSPPPTLLVVGSTSHAVASTSPALTTSIPPLQPGSATQAVSSSSIDLVRLRTLTISNGANALSSSTITFTGSINYVMPVSADGVITTGTDLSASDIRVTMTMRSRFPGDTSSVDAVRMRALANAGEGYLLTENSDTISLSSITLLTDYRLRPPLFHREYGGVHLLGGPGPVSIDATAYPWKTTAFFVKPVSSTTTIFRFGSDESLVATAQGSGRWSINVPSGYTCYIGGEAITDPQVVDFTFPRLVVLTTSTSKAGIMYFGSTGGTGAVSSMSLNHIYAIPVSLSASEVLDMYKRFYGIQSMKMVDSVGTGSSTASIGFAASDWTVGILA